MVGALDLAPHVVVAHLLLGFVLTFPRVHPLSLGMLVAYPLGFLCQIHMSQRPRQRRLNKEQVPDGAMT